MGMFDGEEALILWSVSRPLKLPSQAALMLDSGRFHWLTYQTVVQTTKIIHWIWLIQHEVLRGLISHFLRSANRPLDLPVHIDLSDIIFLFRHKVTRTPQKHSMQIHEITRSPYPTLTQLTTQLTTQLVVGCTLAWKKVLIKIKLYTVTTVMNLWSNRCINLS